MNHPSDLGACQRFGMMDLHCPCRSLPGKPIPYTWTVYGHAWQSQNKQELDMPDAIRVQLAARERWAVPVYSCDILLGRTKGPPS